MQAGFVVSSLATWHPERFQLRHSVKTNPTLVPDACDGALHFHVIISDIRIIKNLDYILITAEIYLA